MAERGTIDWAVLALRAKLDWAGHVERMASYDPSGLAVAALRCRNWRWRAGVRALPQGRVGYATPGRPHERWEDAAPPERQQAYPAGAFARPPAPLGFLFPPPLQPAYVTTNAAFIGGEPKPVDVVVWNPYAAASPGDLPPPAYRKFVCVEPGLVAAPHSLPPRAQAVVSQKIVAV